MSGHDKDPAPPPPPPPSWDTEFGEDIAKGSVVGDSMPPAIRDTHEPPGDDGEGE